MIHPKTLGRALKRIGYSRCIACKRHLISDKQAAERFEWCKIMRPAIVDGLWAKVISSDKASSETVDRGRIWVTRNKYDRFHPDCIQSV
jgi:hypothetical protein